MRWSLFLLCLAVAGAEEFPWYDIRRATSPIVPDGRLDEPAWQKAPPVSDFHFNWWTSGEKEKTVARLLWDDENLYVGYYCHDRHIYAEVTKRHGPVSLDDCVEIFLSPNPDKPRNYYGFEMNVIGTMLNFIRADWWTGGLRWEPDGVRLRTSHHGLPKKEELPDDNHWVLEVAIPFKNFSRDATHTPPRHGDVWRINLNRSGGKTDAQYSTWSPVNTPRPNFHAPESFGYVRFVARNERLYNGIVLPEQWPPRIPFNYEPMDPPYLRAPPDVIPIDVGRQLFVDDFLIEGTDLKRTWHTAQIHPASPVLRADRDWEREGTSPTAMPFSGGVFYDPQDRLFKMWYMCGYVRGLCLATSTDGLRWRKPQLDTRPGTNVTSPIEHDTSTVWLDQEEKDPRKRYKVWLSRAFSSELLAYYTSPDGLRWRDADARSRADIGDRTTVFRNPFRNMWVYSVRTYLPKLGRYRLYWEHPDAAAGTRFAREDPVPWVGADRLDTKRADLNTNPELYNLDAVAYESLMVGLFSIWRGQPKDRAKPNELLLGFSRDGFHWDRPDRRPFIGVSERYGDWNWANIQSAGGGFLVVNEKLYFYVSGRSGLPGTTDSGHSSTGLAVLRRDGFASMDAPAAGGTLTTRPVRFDGKHLFVNLAGELEVEVLDASGNPIAPFVRANCAPVRGDFTRQQVKWTGASDLSSFSGKPVKFRFHLRSGELYSFWVSPSESGASRGYVAAGGPGLSGPADAP